MSSSGLAFVHKASYKKAKALLGATKFNKSHGQPYLLPKQNGNTVFYSTVLLPLYSRFIPCVCVLIESVALEERKSQPVRSQCRNSKQIQKICSLTASLLKNSHHEPKANFGACN